MKETEAEFERNINNITCNTSFQSTIQKKDVSTINNSVYYKSDEQVDKISDSNKQVDQRSDTKEDTHIIDRIFKLSVRPTLFKSAVIGQDLITSVRKTLCERLSPNSLIVKEIITDAACDSAQVNRFAVQPGVNVDFFSPSRGSNSSFSKWLRYIKPLETSGHICVPRK